MFPKTWKQEWCTPVPNKKTALKELKDVRKIASTSDYSKIFEHFLLEFVLEDKGKNMIKRQYGGEKKVSAQNIS